ncbi:hypothetical protein BJ912DRAFT_1144091 [Pholiota molesta]|nr:hypothetical protein BJ912DRAFT_1144091 [Pholiota molesta]
MSMPSNDTLPIPLFQLPRSSLVSFLASYGPAHAGSACSSSLRTMSGPSLLTRRKPPRQSLPQMADVDDSLTIRLSARPRLPVSRVRPSLSRTSAPPSALAVLKFDSALDWRVQMATGLTTIIITLSSAAHICARRTSAALYGFDDAQL